MYITSITILLISSILCLYATWDNIYIFAALLLIQNRRDISDHKKDLDQVLLYVNEFFNHDPMIELF